MTREEAIKKLEHYRYCLKFQYGWYSKDDDEAVEMAIKALEQQPTDAVDRVTIKEYLESSGKDTNVSATDCISREAVMHILDEVGGDFDSPREAVVPIDYIADMVSELPFVTAQPKMGQWIEHFDESGKWYECDQCHTDCGGSVNYCPNCGSKM